MNATLSAAITGERLKKWGNVLASKQATPVVLIGIEHGQQSGKMHILTVEDVSNEVLTAFLVTAAAAVEARKN